MEHIFDFYRYDILKTALLSIAPTCASLSYMTKATRHSTPDMARVAQCWVKSSGGQFHGWVPHGQVILFCPLLGYVLMWAASWLNPWQGSYMAESHMGGYNHLFPLQGCVQSKPIVCPRRVQSFFPTTGLCPRQTHCLSNIFSLYHSADDEAEWAVCYLVCCVTASGARLGRVRSIVPRVWFGAMQVWYSVTQVGLAAMTSWVECPINSLPQVLRFPYQNKKQKTIYCGLL